MNDTIKKLAGFAALVCVVFAAWVLLSGKSFSDYWLLGVLLIAVRGVVLAISAGIHRDQ
ncbi:MULTISPECIES: hypothetical protein [unclassified Streptomyces]|uniref:hypothetical protein n=1 Tax=unclassified Streptomyces TaxID=2593676 RepID=UPI0033D3B9C7